MTMLRRFLSCTRGAAAAEMALITPLAVGIIFTSVEAGHYFYQQHQVIKGVRDGARFAARQSFDDINCRSGTPSTIPTDVATQIRNITRTGQLSSGTPRILSWQDSDTVLSVTCPAVGTIAESQTGIFDGTEPAPQINIVATVSYDAFFNGLGVITDNFTLRGQQQAVVMGI